MARRNLQVHGRLENVREPRQVPHSTQFGLDAIKRHFDESMSTIRAQSDIADSLIRERKTEAAQTVWRSQIVLFAGVLDFYLHELRKYGLNKIFDREWEETESYKKLDIPISIVQSALQTPDSTDWFFDFVNLRFSYVSFLSVKEIKALLSQIGISYERVMVSAFPTNREDESRKKGDRILDEQFQRRNAIVHQMDRSHESAEQNDITKEYVTQYADNITKVADAIHEQAKEKRQ